jgi:alginate O-acetyltransferase complex protein AlgJ
MKAEKIRIILIPLLFLSALVFPFLNQKIQFIAPLPNYENRRPATKPALTFSNLKNYPTWYEAYYNDTFPLRWNLLRAFSIYQLSVFKKPPCPDLVIIGNDNWLFLKGDEFNTFTGESKFATSELKEITNELEYRRQYLEKRNCKFYVMIAPAKANIYPEKVPFEYFRTVDRSSGEVLNGYLKKNSKVNVVDVYPVLREHKKDFRVYYSNDNHWSRMAGFYASNQFIQQYRTYAPEVKPIDLKDYKIIERDTTKGNTVHYLGDFVEYHDVNYVFTGEKAKWGTPVGYVAPEKFPYKWGYEQVRDNETVSTPKLLIISDSFGEYILELLSERFGKSVKIWDNWEYKLNENIVESEKPDVMLLVIHEQNLKKLLVHPKRTGIK